MGVIFGYARGSAGDLEVPGEVPGNVAGQTARLHQAGAVQVFCDTVPGRPLDQPGLRRLLATARTGDTVAVVALDHLGWTIAEVLSVAATLRRHGIALLSLDEAIDTRTADGALALTLFAALAQCERRLAAERRQARIAAVRAHGRRRGRPPLDTAKVSAALRLVRSGVSPAAAARQLRLGRSTIYRAVSRAGIERVAPVQES